MEYWPGDRGVFVKTQFEQQGALYLPVEPEPVEGLHFDFSIEPRKPEKYVERQIQGYEKTNGLFRALELGYSAHIPVAIRPDDVLNTIGCIWAKYIVLNAERFRDFFVDHESPHPKM